MYQTASISQMDEISLLNSIVVRPISSDERSGWDGLMAKHHYLGFKSLFGESIRNVAPPPPYRRAPRWLYWEGLPRPYSAVPGIPGVDGLKLSNGNGYISSPIIPDS